MFPRYVTLILFFTIIAGCASKPPPPPPKDYQLEALQNQVREVNHFIDNWTGFKQEYSSINSLDEYKETRQKILSSPAYLKLTNQRSFEGKTNQFDAIVKRYEIWIEERSAMLTAMDQFLHQYKSSQQLLFSKHAKPLAVGSYELAVANAYYHMEPVDPDQAYASARYVGLKQLNIIAASKDQPLRLPHLAIADFVVEVKITNRSSKKILRPDGFIVHRQSKSNKSGSFIARSFREYLVQFSDNVNNRYEFSQALDVINKDSENGIRPGNDMIWSYHFNEDNHPLDTVKTFQIIFPQKVFGKPLKLKIPTQTIQKPKLPNTFSAG